MNKDFIHFLPYFEVSKMKKILVQLFFSSLLLHKGTKKNPNSGYISTIFFHYHVMRDFTKKVRWQRRITTVNDKIDAFLFHHFYFQKMDRKKTIKQHYYIALLITLWYFFNTKSYSQAALKQLFPQSLFKTHMFLTTNCL